MHYFKNVFSLFVLITASVVSFSQGVGIGITTPDPTAALDIVANNKGLLVPRLSSIQRTGIAAPANGLLVYDLDSSSLFIYQLSAWKKLKAISKLGDIISGTANGDILVWNGTEWIVTPKTSIYTYVYRDVDGDGYGDKYKPVAGILPFEGFVNDSTDCNDVVFTTHPGAVDICGDGIDNDCDGLIDEDINGNTDLPDDGFNDTNCDGIDGTESQAIFVSATGNNTNPGTKTLPVQTITEGIAKALAGSKTQVYVSMGTYNEKVTLVNGISIYGGYNAATAWSRSAANTTAIVSNIVASGSLVAVAGNTISASTTIDRFSISTTNAAVVNINNYAIHCVGCTGLELKNLVINAGNGGNGAAGTNGANGNTGFNGINGVDGYCDENLGGTGGNGGGNGSCVNNGGNGGNGGYNTTAPTAGLGGTPTGGGGGAAGVTGNPGTAGANATGGVNGTDGTSGPGSIGGSVLADFWNSAAGIIGTNGISRGTPGGGGGGGGGQIGTFIVRGKGNGGGGGGAGGCTGVAGAGGNGGGGSFGIFLVSSTGIQISNSTITSGNGGAGGNGGNGGLGGSGGTGGLGASFCLAEIGKGGNGGAGGRGGHAGAGGGAAGGPSFSIYRSGTVVTPTGCTLNFGTPGNGGNGGNFNGVPSGLNGGAGASGTIF